MTSARAALRRILRVVLIPGPRAGRMLSYRRSHSIASELRRARTIGLVEPKARGHPQPEITREMLEASERVLAAFSSAEREAAEHEGPRGMWKELISRQYRSLNDALELGEPRRLAILLEKMFVTSTTAGLSMGSEIEWTSTARGRAFFASWWVDGALCMGAYLGALPEEMETGEASIRSARDFVSLLSDIEGELGAAIQFPRVCGAWGISYAERLIPRSAWRHLHSAHVLHRMAAQLTRATIAEVGGGFGGVAYWFHHLATQPSAFALYDFPIVNAISGYFLIRAEVPTRLLGEPDAGESTSVLPYWRLFDEADASIDLLFNQDSLPEMPRETAVDYLHAFDRLARVGFYSENQESGAPWQRGEIGSAQLRLPALDAEFRRLKLLYRHRAWMRRGYVESFYSPAPGA